MTLPALLRLTLIPCLLLMSAWAFSAENTMPSWSPKQLDKLAEVYAVIKREYVDATDDDQLLNDAIQGMVSGLDAHSTYLDFEAMKDNGVPNKGPFGGLGIEVAMEDGLVRVVAPIEDTPAYRAGIRAGDLISMIDDTPVKGMSLGQAIQRMRGSPDSTVRLNVIRKHLAQPLAFNIVRAVINNPSVKFKLSEPGYPYLRITQFRDATGEDIARALREIHEQNGGPLKGLVLDLRDNPGGSLVSAIAVSSAFLERDALVVSSTGRAKDTAIKLYANPDNYVEGGADNDYLKDLPPELRSIPLVVLVNGGSASASEIVSGALQDHRRATLMGSRTYGKGTIQTLVPLSSGSAVKLTIARYYTPNGRSIQDTGILPDIAAAESPQRSESGPPPSPGTSDDPLFVQAIRFLKTGKSG